MTDTQQQQGYFLLISAVFTSEKIAVNKPVYCTRIGTYSITIRSRERLYHDRTVACTGTTGPGPTPSYCAAAGCCWLLGKVLGASRASSRVPGLRLPDNNSRIRRFIFVVFDSSSSGVLLFPPSVFRCLTSKLSRLFKWISLHLCTICSLLLLL